MSRILRLDLKCRSRKTKVSGSQIESYPVNLSLDLNLKSTH